jgi:hypothetical protein
MLWSPPVVCFAGGVGPIQGICRGRMDNSCRLLEECFEYPCGRVQCKWTDGQHLSGEYL